MRLNEKTMRLNEETMRSNQRAEAEDKKASTANYHNGQAWREENAEERHEASTTWGQRLRESEYRDEQKMSVSLGRGRAYCSG